MNKITIIGRLTKRSEMRILKGSNTKVATFSLATRGINKDVDGNTVTEFFECKAYGKKAEIIENYTDKGTQICVIGAMSSFTYKERKCWEVVVDDIELLGGRNDNAQNGEISVIREPKQTTLEEVSRDEDLPF